MKQSQVDKTTNILIFFLFIILIALSLLSSVITEIWHNQNEKKHWYINGNVYFRIKVIKYFFFNHKIDLDEDTNNFGFNFLTFILLYNNLIPISLQVTLEVIRFLQAFFIGWV